jgi:hypothetical protein
MNRIKTENNKLFDYTIKYISKNKILARILDNSERKH